MSRRWVYELVRRFDTEGEAGLQPRSRRPRRSPHRTPEALEDEIVELRKELLDHGLDAGAHTIAVHLGRRHGRALAVSTIWRILSRRGFVTPQPQKRPRPSFIRFEADQPNERWQADITHWRLGRVRDGETPSLRLGQMGRWAPRLRRRLGEGGRVVLVDRDLTYRLAPPRDDGAASAPTCALARGGGL